MKKKNSILVIILMLAMLILASCNEDSKTSLKESTISPSTEATVIATETIEMTPTPTPTVTISTEKFVFEEYELIDMSVFDCNYLQQAQKAFVFDNDVSDGLLMQDEFTEVQLPAGTILKSLDSIREGLEPYPGTMLFMLEDGRCVFFDQDISEDGKPLYNGKLLSDLLGAYKLSNDWDEGLSKIVKNYELLPETPLDPSIFPQNIIINVDWNGDGKTDTITRECADAEWTWEQKVWFTDGATGAKTDITYRFAIDEGGARRGLSDSVMLFEDEKTGRYTLIDCKDTCSCDYSVFVYSYDSQSIITYTETYGVFAYEDGEMYLDYGSFIFGNQGAMREPLIFDGKSVKKDPSVREFWWLAAIKAQENGDAVPGYFSYTWKEVPVEKKTASGYEHDVIPEGIAVFPKYYTWNNNEVRDSGVLYFVLADGSEYRIAFEQEPDDWNCTFGGVPQEEVFHCSWGG